MEIGVIESGVKLQPKNRRAICLAGLLRSLKVGDSFVWHASKRDSIHPSAARIGIKVSVRAVSDEHIRVWRVEAA